MKRLFAATALALVTPTVGCTGDPDESTNLFAQWDAQRDAAVRDAFVGGAFPAAYRFECINIHKLGEPLDGGKLPFQATVLNRLWLTDITDHKLNILIGIDALEPDGSAAQVYIGSGVGLDDASQCREPTTDGTRFTAPIMLNSTRYKADGADTVPACTLDAAAGDQAFGTVAVDVPSTDAIYIYAQSEKQVTFNCTPDPELPNAVPLRYVSAVVTVTEDTGGLAGELTACLTKADIGTLCSCIGECTAESTEDVLTTGGCAGCPRGAAPLTAQLSGLRSSARCAELAGGDAYELKATFHARRLPGNPDVCGG
jgi:hypothetical protein